jgi:hypothetical protein
VKLPPRHPVPLVTPVSATTASARPGSPLQGASTSLLPTATSGAGPLFRAPQSRSAVRLRALLADGKLQRRRASRGARGLPGELPEGDDDNQVPSDNRVVVSMSMDTSLGGGDGQGGEREGNQKEKRFTRIARLRRVIAETVSDPDLAQLLSKVRAATALDDVAAALLPALAKRREEEVAMFVSVARAWQASRPEESSLPTTNLADVKHALTQTSGSAATASGVQADDRRAIVNLWLPIYLLNLSRPRSALQRQQASDRLALIERGVARLVTGTG